MNWLRGFYKLGLIAQIGLVALFLWIVGLLLGGCTTANTRWGDPGAVTATKADMAKHEQDSYQCYRESKQDIGFGEFASSTQRDAQRLYNLCMRGRGYTIEEKR